MKLSLGRWLLPLYTALALLFLLIPIVYTIVLVTQLGAASRARRLAKLG